MLIIPNATDTTGGNKYAALDQAEPDSLDFEVAGNAGRSGVVSGLAVVSNSSAFTVNVAGGVIALNGAAYPVTGVPAYGLPSAPADNRFDLIIARVTGGVAALVTISGVNSAVNPTFPKSRGVITSAFDAATHVDLDTDVLIAAVYRTGSTVITTSRIMDKRAMQASGIVLQGTAAPTNAIGQGTGNLYFKSNTTDDDTTTSGVYVKLSNGEWIPLAKDVGLHLPIGSMVEWPTAAPVPDHFAEALGQYLDTVTYPTLFSRYGYEHGGSGTIFRMPSYINVYKRGTSTGAIVGDSLGVDSFTLSSSQIPSHTHNNPHTHSFPHTHGLDHSHSTSVSDSGAHSHASGTLATTGVGGRNPVLREASYAATVYATGYYGDYGGALPFGPLPPGTGPGTGSVPIANGAGGYSGGYFGGGMAISQVDSALVNSGNTASVGTHTHTVTVVSYTGVTTSQSTSTTNSTTATTDPTGASDPIFLIPASKYVRNIIRVS